MPKNAVILNAYLLKRQPITAAAIAVTKMIESAKATTPQSTSIVSSSTTTAFVVFFSEIVGFLDATLYVPVTRQEAPDEWNTPSSKD